MKKVLSICIALILALSFATVAWAADSNCNEENEKQLAYLDYDSATPEMKARILEARNAIIFSSDWVADGCSGCIQNVETGEIIKTLPSFSELYPDWEIPSQNNFTSASEEAFANPASVNTRDSWLNLGSTYYYLSEATNVNTTPFVTFLVDPYRMGTAIRTYAASLTSSQTCNIGYSDATTGTSLAYATYLSLNQALVVYDVGDVNLAVRASTYSTPGWSIMAIDGSSRLVDLK